MLRILFVRHGETEWNRERRIMGREEVGLNETGRGQCSQLTEVLRAVPLDAVYSSPILRARETAEILTRERPSPIRLDERLWEIDYGSWVGKTFEEVRRNPGYVPYFQRLDTPVAPGGETLDQVRDRAMDFLNAIKKEGLNRTVMVVSHADTIKCILMTILQIPFSNIWRFRIDNLSVSLVECDEYGDRVICVNQRGDWERLFTTRVSF